MEMMAEPHLIIIKTGTPDILLICPPKDGRSIIHLICNLNDASNINLSILSRKHDFDIPYMQ